VPDCELEEPAEEPVEAAAPPATTAAEVVEDVELDVLAAETPVAPSITTSIATTNLSIFLHLN
jgi:hypothetical protein